MPTWYVKFTQLKSGKSKPTIWTHRVYFDKDTDTLQVAYNAGLYVAQLISYPTTPGDYHYLFDEMLCSYPINIEIRSIKNVRKFTLKQTRSELSSFIKVDDKFYTILDEDTNKPIAIPRDMFNELKKKFSFDIKETIPFDKRKSPEILTPIGGAVKKKRPN